MNDSITLLQHFYSSATIGLTTGRGFKSLAKSKEIPSHAALEGHCIYAAPKKNDALHPVKWGWFVLDDRNACLHRIAYSGTDDINRPGNYFAHNLVVSQKNLACIDFDVPTLLEWVRRHGAQRANGDRSGDGFLHGHRQLYRHLGWDPANLAAVSAQEKARLTQIEPLPVPIADLRRLGEEEDQRVEAGLLPAVLQALGEDGLRALIQAVCCEPDKKKSVLILGLGNGADESALEQNIVRLLFSVLPFHCRRHWTYTTYEEDPLAATRKTGSQRNRRLMFSTRFNEVTLPNAQANYPLWVVNGVTQNHVVPDPTEYSKHICSLLLDGDWKTLLALRRAADCFDFPDEWTGLQQICQILPDQERKPDAKALRVFFDLAPVVRPGKTHYVELALHHLGHWPPKGGAALTVSDMTTMCLDGLSRALNPKAGEPQPELATTALSRLLWRAFESHEKNADASALILERFSKDQALRPYCSACLKQFFQELNEGPDRSAFNAEGLLQLEMVRHQVERTLVHQQDALAISATGHEKVLETNWPALKKRLCRDCFETDAETSYSYLTLWFADRRSLMERLETYGLLAGLAAEITGWPVPARQESALTELLMLDHWLAQNPPATPAEAIQNRVVLLLTRLISEIHEKLLAGPSAAGLSRSLQIAAPVAKVVSKLDDHARSQRRAKAGRLEQPTVMEQYWENLAMALKECKPPERHKYFPAVFELGCALQQAREENVWRDLLDLLITSYKGKKAKFHGVFVDLAESLYGAVERCPTASAADSLFALRKEECYFLDYFADPSPPHFLSRLLPWTWGRSRNSSDPHKAGLRDALVGAVPETWQSDPDRHVSAIACRARLVSSWYGDDRKLPKILLDLAKKVDVELPTSVRAAVLFGYLTSEGLNAVVERATNAATNGVWKALKADKVANTLARLLKSAGFKKPPEVLRCLGVKDESEE